MADEISNDRPSTSTQIGDIVDGAAQSGPPSTGHRQIALKVWLVACVLAGLGLTYLGRRRQPSNEPQIEFLIAGALVMLLGLAPLFVGQWLHKRRENAEIRLTDHVRGHAIDERRRTLVYTWIGLAFVVSAAALTQVLRRVEETDRSCTPLKVVDSDFCAVTKVVSIPSASLVLISALFVIGAGLAALAATRWKSTVHVAKPEPLKWTSPESLDRLRGRFIVVICLAFAPIFAAGMLSPNESPKRIPTDSTCTAVPVPEGFVPVTGEVGPSGTITVCNSELIDVERTTIEPHPIARWFRGLGILLGIGAGLWWAFAVAVERGTLLRIERAG